MLIKGGRVIDPAAGSDGVLDVAVRGDRIADVAPGIDAGLARRLLKVPDCVVSPGLIDLHAHVYAGATYWGIDVAEVYGPQPVTTVVDAGSAGAMNLAGLVRHVVRPTSLRILAWLNISSIGLVHRTYELAHPAYCNPDAAREALAAFSDVVVGLKARVDAHTVGEQGVRPLAAAARLAHELELPLMVHIGAAPPQLAEILAEMARGDVLTHCFTGSENRIVTEDQAGKTRLHPALLAALDRGVRLDVGHGKGSFAFTVAEAALALGLKPDSISTDLHRWNVDGPVFTLLHTMAKFLALGMTLSEVVAAVTAGPAAVLGRDDLGTLTGGTPADVAVFRVAEEAEPAVDTRGDRRQLPRRLVPRAVVRGGRLSLLRDDGPVRV